jgi:protein SCO1/2
MSRRLLVILALLAVAFAVLTGLAIQRGVLAPRNAANDQTAAVGGPFQLVDQTGRTVDQRVLEGKWSAVFFGYSFCPDACPTTLFALGQAETMLGASSDRFQTVFISVDPARDTPKQLASFLSTDAFPKRVIGLTGSPAQVENVAHAYHVYFQKAGDGTSYAVNHSTITYLMNPKGGFACVIPYSATPQQIVSQVRAAMAKGEDASSC